MRRALLILLLSLAWPAAAHAESVKVADCVPALDPLARSVDLRGAHARPRARPHAGPLHAPGARGRPDGLASGSAAPGFDAWLSSASGVRRYSYAKTVENLAAPAAYRAVVRFRWLDEDGRVADRSRRTSAACRQPDLRPNLVPRRVEVAPAAEDGMARYVVLLRNPGASDAGPFTVGLRAGDRELEPQVLFGLGAGLEGTVTFTGPACTAGTPLTVTADATGGVDERNETDNVLATACRP